MVEQLSRSEPPPERPGRADLAIGAFTADGPWTVEPATMPWRYPAEAGGDIDNLRREAAELARQLIAPQRLPPVGRVVAVGIRLGSALLGWAMTDRGTPTS